MAGSLQSRQIEAGLLYYLQEEYGSTSRYSSSDWLSQQQWPLCCECL